MSFYGYEYFASANVILEIEGIPVLECAGIALASTESKRPVYGYSSRHFDGVARGQVIVQGSILVNYVHDEYLFKLIQMGLQNKGLLGGAEVPKTQREQIKDQMGLAIKNNQLLDTLLQDYRQNVEIAEAFKSKYWDLNRNDPLEKYSPNAYDSFGGLDIKITYGTRNLANNYSGKTGKLIEDVYFTGERQNIAVSEDVIVEEYPFFARRTSSYKQQYNLSRPTESEEDLTVTKIEE